ncbi:hypothetical protein RR46_10565 [Papilio xuthus]|uniref:Uncharacterized protein n=1 Tax=Papilio xuthus TaxID=66420 RepID=A0A194PQ94_PAPXU|nr:hypothetical protein RR46_10565 [Papilio xuthus]
MWVFAPYDIGTNKISGEFVGIPHGAQALRLSQPKPAAAARPLRTSSPPGGVAAPARYWLPLAPASQS